VCTTTGRCTSSSSFVPLPDGHLVTKDFGGALPQSVLFPAPGFGRDFYVCSFLALTRVEVVPA
jgi:hypothetical protein